jgi:hypothetical protein
MSPRKTIRTVASLTPYLGQAIKYSFDGGYTWKYAKLLDEPLQQLGTEGLGYQSRAEVEEDGVCRMIDLTAKKFSQGMIAQPVTRLEIKGKEWSYE